jgi:hypothetical protein
VKTNRSRAPRRIANGVSDTRTRGRRSAFTEATPAIPTPLSSNVADLIPITTALAELNEGELCALIDSTNDLQQIVPGLLAWIGHACDWELNRRACVDFPLQSPEAAIPQDKQTASLAAVMALRATFHHHGLRNGCAVVALFDAMIRALTHAERWH